MAKSTSRCPGAPRRVRDSARVPDVPVNRHVVDEAACLLKQQPPPLDDLGAPGGHERGHQLDGGIRHLHHLRELGAGARVLLRRLVADLPGAVDLVADPPVRDAVRLVEPVRAPEPRERAVARAVAVLHPVARLPHVPVAAVHDEVGLGVHLAAEADHLVGADLVVLDEVPSDVVAHRAVALRAHAVHPAVPGDGVAPDAADVRDFQATRGLQHVGAESVVIGERGIGLVDAAIHGAQLLEQSEDVAIDRTRDSLQGDGYVVQGASSIRGHPTTHSR